MSISPTGRVLWSQIAGHLCQRQAVNKRQYSRAYTILLSHLGRDLLRSILGFGPMAERNSLAQTLNRQGFRWDRRRPSSLGRYDMSPKRLAVLITVSTPSARPVAIRSKPPFHFFQMSMDISTHSPKNGTIVFGRPSSKAQAVVPAPP